MPLDGDLLPLLVKVTGVIAIVIAASIAAERAGPFWGGLIASLPVSAGPGYVLLALQGAEPGFIAQSALSSVTGNAATIVFLLAVIKASPRFHVLVTLAVGLATWFAALWLIRLHDWSAPAALLLNLVAFAICFRATRGLDRIARPATPPRSWLALGLRAILIGGLVAGVATASATIGPGTTGSALVFPLAFTSFILMLHGRIGGVATAATMASALRALPGFAMALMVLHLVATAGIMLALVAALGASIAYAVLLAGLRLRLRPAPAPAG